METDGTTVDEPPHADEVDHASHTAAKVGTGALALGALGVVFGDIGTSPLYAFRESFEHQHIAVTEANALGIASTAFWALVIIICIKYLTFVMRADNHGEGGILALTALVMPTAEETATGGRKRRVGGLVLLGVFGTALLYGDGLITPAISVLSAVEGFEVASPALKDFVIPLAVVILAVLFLVQKRGTEAVGKVFGPVMIAWFSVIGALGLIKISGHPAVLGAINPVHIVDFFADQPGKAFLTLGSIFLVVTGGEALYADMGHFGRRPIMLVWYGVVLPGLLLNYFGQAATLIQDPSAIESPLYRMAPDWAITPLAILATAASVIASQALISGAFSLTVQAVQLDYLPRLAIRHTSGKHHGQVYVPLVNWLLMIGSIGLVLGFRTSSALAAAYGIAVTTTMVITTLLFAVIARDRWGWSVAKTAALIVPLLAIDSAFLAANVPKIPHGGWFPLLIAVVLVLQMVTWRRGRQIVDERMDRADYTVASLLEQHPDITRVPGTAIFLCKHPEFAPPALTGNLLHNKVLHERTLIVSVEAAHVPIVADGDRLHISELAPSVQHVNICFGFMEENDVPAALAGLDVDDATYFIGRESVIAADDHRGMPPILEELFVLLNRGADDASRFFHLPSDRVFEVGTKVEI